MTRTPLKGRAAGGVYRVVPLTALRVGAQLRSPIFESREDRNLLLLAAGTTLTANLLERLKKRGISHVRIDARELARITNLGGSSAPRVRVSPRVRRSPATQPGGTTSKSSTAQQPNTKPGDGLPAASTAKRVTNDSYLHKVSKCSEAYDEQTVGELTASYQESAVQMECFFQALASGDACDAKAVVQVASEAVDQLSRDLDLFTVLGLNPDSDGYPSKHGLNTSMLSMALGAVLGLSRAELIEMGIGCLIHDAGMLRIDKKLITSPKSLSRIEFLEITKHPGVTYDLIRDFPEIPTGARMVAYQIHERWNGKGYPRQREGERIHPLARIAAVADVFTALISPRPHRPGMLPYCAMEQVLRGVREGLFDPAVARALLETVSLFPVGSYVEMNDGRVGRVIRSTGQTYMRPVVELWHPDQPSLPHETVDLRQELELAVRRPIPPILADGSDSADVVKDANVVQDNWE